MTPLPFAMPGTVIVADGTFPSHPLPLQALAGASFICCCDGALPSLLDYGIIPHAICGDGDSLTPQHKRQFASLLHMEGEQVDNDLTKATRYCISQGHHRLAYIGATGLREDHTLGNISLMAQYVMEFGIVPIMLTDYGYFTAIMGQATLPTSPRQQVSIFNFGCQRLESEGLRWPTYPFSLWWQGTLNEALSDHITLHAIGGVCVVFLTYEVKTDGRH